MSQLRIFALITIASVALLGCSAKENSELIAGAPMLGDAGAWTDRLTKGIETVYTNAINGINGMPARGTCMDCSDDEVIAAIDYILDNSK